jgi:hypothetical protein
MPIQFFLSKRPLGGTPSPAADETPAATGVSPHLRPGSIGIRRRLIFVAVQLPARRRHAVHIGRNLSNQLKTAVETKGPRGMTCKRCGNVSRKDGHCLECGAPIFNASWELALVAMILLFVSIVLRWG